VRREIWMAHNKQAIVAAEVLRCFVVHIHLQSFGVGYYQFRGNGHNKAYSTANTTPATTRTGITFWAWRKVIGSANAC
jgi:hypothetical protein